MRRLLASRTASATAAALLGMLVAGGGFALASGGGKIKACVHHGTHVLYTGKCKSGDKKLSWNKAGVAGPQGPAGTPATKLFAAVNANGTFSASQSSGVTSVTLLATGQYDVEFNQNVRDCAYVAGGGEAGSGSSGSAAFYNATGRSSSVDGVFLETRNDAGTETSESFYLAVLC